MLKLLSNAAVFAGSRGITPVGTEKANNPFWLLAIGDQCGPDSSRSCQSGAQECASCGRRSERPELL